MPFQTAISAIRRICYVLPDSDLGKHYFLSLKGRILLQKVKLPLQKEGRKTNKYFQDELNKQDILSDSEVFGRRKKSGRSPAHLCVLFGTIIIVALL
jgi:hypothetical protein